MGFFEPNIESSRTASVDGTEILEHTGPVEDLRL